MFRNKVIEAVRDIPAGKVTYYGNIAAIVGKPRSARQVGFVLRSLSVEEKDIPWWRVVNKKGYLSIDQGAGGLEKALQKSLLEEEGIEFEEYSIIDLKSKLYSFT